MVYKFDCFRKISAKDKIVSFSLRSFLGRATYRHGVVIVWSGQFSN